MASTASSSTAPPTPQGDEFPYLTQLERRIGRLLDLVSVLKQERQRLERENAVLLQEQDTALRDKKLALDEKTHVIRELSETRATLAVTEAVANEAKLALSQGIHPVEIEKARAEAHAAKRQTDEAQRHAEESQRHADEAQAAARKWAEQVELSKAEVSRLNDAIGRLKIERQQVRERIEKVLGQMDALNAPSHG